MSKTRNIPELIKSMLNVLTEKKHARIIFQITLNPQS